MSVDQAEGVESQVSERGEDEIINKDVSANEENLEEGELEDGEIDDEPAEVTQNPVPVPTEHQSPVKESNQIDHNGHKKEQKESKSSRDKKKRKRRRDNQDENDTRKKNKKKRYVDHDRINDDGEMQWLGEKQHSGHKSRRHRDRDSRSPNPEVYDSPYDSPPGLYDSPSDGEVDEQRNGPKSMLGLVQDDFMDVSISAQERHTGEVQETTYPEKRDREKRTKKKYKPRPEGSRHRDRESKKTPLEQLPRSERPLCKFFKEGKCHKGPSCPFNHDFEPEKKLDVCKYYLAGACNRENCLYLHNEFPCKYFHTGKVCYAEGNCRFSHEPMSEEMEEVFDRMMEEEFLPKKPSLLGSPPRHIVEEAERLKERREYVKKIPSIFDIETFPPGHSPHKSPQKNISPARKAGFYNEYNEFDEYNEFNEFNEYNEAGPPPDHTNNQGPPQGGPPINNFGPPMNMGPPNNIGGPNMGGPMNSGMGNLGPPPMNNMGPRMNCPPPGFQGGPPDMSMGPNAPVAPGSVLNMIGAILRTAAPLINNQMSQASVGPQGLATQPGHQAPSSGFSGHTGSQSGSTGPQLGPYGPQHGGLGQSGHIGQSPNHPGMNDGLNMNYDSTVNTTHNHSAENLAKTILYRQESNGSNSDSNVNLPHDDEQQAVQSKPLDPRARMRLAARNDLKADLLPFPSKVPRSSSDEEHQQKEEERRYSTDDDRPPPPQPEMNFGPKFEFSKDDNWYSSDEENDGDRLTISSEMDTKPKLKSSSTINIMEMISNVKNEMEQQKPPAFYAPSMTYTKSYNRIEVPVTHCVLTTMLYRIKTFTLNLDKPYDTIPKNIDPVDSRYQSDPRVQKYSQRLARKNIMAKAVTAPPVEKKVDRLQLPDLNLNMDGTINIQKAKTLDPRMSRNTSIEEPKAYLDPRSRSDPRMLRNISNEDQKPKFSDPRLSRNTSMEDKKPIAFDPRLSRASSVDEQTAFTSDPRMSRNIISTDSLKPPILDPRMSRKTSIDEKSPIYQDPRIRRVAKTSIDSVSLVKNTLGGDLDNLIPKPPMPRVDPRIARSMSMETSIPNT